MTRQTTPPPPGPQRSIAFRRPTASDADDDDAPASTMSAAPMTQRGSQFATTAVARAPRASVSRGAAASQRRGALVVRGAASKAKKQGQLDALSAMATAEETFLVAGFNYQSLSVRAAESRFYSRQSRARVEASDDDDDDAQARG